MFSFFTYSLLKPRTYSLRTYLLLRTYFGNQSIRRASSTVLSIILDQKVLFVFLLWTSLEQKQKRLKNTYHSFLKPRAYFVTTVCIGEPDQQKLRPSINLSTNNSKAMQLFAMRRCLSYESTIVPNREVRGLNISRQSI